MPDRVKNLGSEVWGAVRLLGLGLVDVSVWTIIGSCLAVKFYVVVMLCVAYLLGVNPWATIIPPLIPLSALWFWVQMKRERNHWALVLRSQPKEWDINKTLKEYAELLQEQKRGKQRRTNESFCLPTQTLA